MRPWSMAPLLALVATLTLATSALAGDDATATLDSQPGIASAGEPIEIGFTLRQHGETLVSWPDAYITATNPETGETVRADATPQGPEGHYVATLTLPSAGTWTWAVATTELEVTTTLEPLIVSASPAAGAAGTQSASPALLMGLVAIALITTVVGAVVVRRARTARQQAPVSV